MRFYGDVPNSFSVSMFNVCLRRYCDALAYGTAIFLLLEGPVSPGILDYLWLVDPWYWF